MRRRLHLPRIATTLLLITLIMYPAAAQEGYPLPESLPPLTPDNAAQIQPLAAIGSTLPGALAWSPDDRWLAVGTSNGVQVYDSLDWNAPPRLIDADRNVSFNAAGELVSGGERRNIETGESLGAASPPVLPPRHPEVQITRDDASGETVVILQRDDGTSATLPLGGSYYFGGIVYSPDKSLAALTLFYDVDNNQLLDIQLWDMVHETRLGDLPQSLEIPLLVTFHADGKLLVIATTTDAEYGGPFEQVSVWDVQAGEYVGPYGYLPAVISPDGEILAFMTGAGVALWTDHEVGILKYDYAYDETGHPEILFSSDSRTLITPSGSKVLLWNVSTETVPDAPRQIITAAAPISRLQQNPSASLLVAEEGGRTLEVWDAKTHERLWSLLDTGSGV
ncbi:MAG: hypothetical protein K8I60_07130, partial [Anaerolineae bacterium]|nr:hypothetical protein [Anaerolineae bacterium]